MVKMLRVAKHQRQSCLSVLPTYSPHTFLTTRCHTLLTQNQKGLASHKAAAVGPHHSSTPAPAAAHWPAVDWTRYNIQVLFVDETDTVRARLAAGLFEKIAEWNGYGRALYPWTCGLHPASKGLGDISKLVAIMNGAQELGVAAKSFTRATEQFEIEDLDRFDLIVTLDSNIRDLILAKIQQEHQGEWLQHYQNKLCLLTTFSQYGADSTVTAVGAFSLLPLKLSFLLKPGLQQSREVVDILSPQLTEAGAEQQWSSMVQALILANAGLVKYLIDAYPEDLPHWDPDA